MSAKIPTVDKPLDTKWMLVTCLFPHGLFLYIGIQDGFVIRRKFATDEIKELEPSSALGSVTGLFVSSRGHLWVSLERRNSIRVWDFENRKLLACVENKIVFRMLEWQGIVLGASDLPFHFDWHQHVRGVTKAPIDFKLNLQKQFGSRDRMDVLLNTPIDNAREEIESSEEGEEEKFTIILSKARVIEKWNGMFCSGYSDGQVFVYRDFQSTPLNFHENESVVSFATSKEYLFVGLGYGKISKRNIRGELLLTIDSGDLATTMTVRNGALYASCHFTIKYDLNLIPLVKYIRQKNKIETSMVESVVWMGGLFEGGNYSCLQYERHLIQWIECYPKSWSPEKHLKFPAAMRERARIVFTVLSKRWQVSRDVLFSIIKLCMDYEDQMFIDCL